MSPEPKAKAQLEWDSLNAELTDLKQKAARLIDEAQQAQKAS